MLWKRTTCSSGTGLGQGLESARWELTVGPSLVPRTQTKHTRLRGGKDSETSQTQTQH